MPLLQLSALEDEGREIAGADPPPDAQLASRQMKALLDEAIGQLPADYRAVYQMRGLEELRGDEVAKRLKISEAAMKSRLHRAREMVRQHLDAALLRH